MRTTRRREESQAGNIKLRELLDLPPDERVQRNSQAAARGTALIANRTKGPKADALMGGMNGQQRETLQALNNPEQVVVDELMQAKLLRAIYSERQLEEVMTDFWFNHFNIFINKGADRFLVTSYERDAIRPHVLGKFEDLLVATAKSPAMLFYLDNWLSMGPDSEVAHRAPPARVRDLRRASAERVRLQTERASPKQASGLNENYGRELMELHTLSVNGGYSQKDVTEVAKVFTGWTIEQPNKGGGFKFDAAACMSRATRSCLDIASSKMARKKGCRCCTCWRAVPHTAHFISQKLAMRFVSDDPAARAGRSHDENLSEEGWRHPRSAARPCSPRPEFWAPQRTAPR